MSHLHFYCSPLNTHTINILAFKLVARKLQDQNKTLNCVFYVLYCNKLAEEGHFLPAFEDLCPDGSFAHSLKSIPKGQMLSTQTDGMNQVLKMEAVCVVELLNALAISVSCRD